MPDLRNFKPRVNVDLDKSENNIPINQANQHEIQYCTLNEKISGEFFDDKSLIKSF